MLAFTPAIDITLQVLPRENKQEEIKDSYTAKEEVILSPAQWIRDFVY